MAQLRNVTAPHKWRHRGTIENICKRTKMFVMHATFDSVAAYLSGLDGATGCLKGFREWVVVQVGDGNNLGWPALIQFMVFDKENTPEDQKINRLWELLQAFEKDATDEVGNFDLNRIYKMHDAWLREQSWFNPHPWHQTITQAHHRADNHANHPHRNRDRRPRWSLF